MATITINIPVGVSRYDGNWTANLRVGKRQYRKFFSIKKYGEVKALYLAIEARIELAGPRRTRCERICEDCSDHFVAKGKGSYQRFCSDKCRVRHFENAYRERTGTSYRNRNGSPYQPVRPPYERPEIPYERETELPLLVEMRQAVAIDGPVFDEDNRHQFVPSESLTPLEALILKEEQESGEYLDRARRITEWENYCNRTDMSYVA